MEIQGKIKLVGNVQEITDSFRKRELVIVTQEQYPQTLCVEFVQDKIDLLNDFQEGQDVKIGINLRGREWKNPEGLIKYFTSLQGWRIESVKNQNLDNQESPLDSLSSFEPAENINKEDLDDLPF
tara:strand:- start:2480 stop:2854 length:375 start_codon:yes stop_codon:yes gene_type:complete